MDAVKARHDQLLSQTGYRGHQPILQSGKLENSYAGIMGKIHRTRDQAPGL